MNKLGFFDEVHDFQRFVRNNIELIGDYTIISEQLMIRNNETGILDMLVVDDSKKRLAIIELKNETTTDKNVWQPIRYYDLLKRGEDSLRDLLNEASHEIGYSIDEIDLNPELVLVVPKCNDQLLRTLSYFNDIDSTVVQVSRKQSKNAVVTSVNRFYPTSIFHKDDTIEIVNKVAKDWNFKEYLNHGISKDKIELAANLTKLIKDVFIEKGYSFDLFFTETKVTITKNGKVWGHLFVKQRPLDYKLTFSFKADVDSINRNSLQFNSTIESFDIQKSKLKLVLHSLPNKEILKNI